MTAKCTEVTRKSVSGATISNGKIFMALTRMTNSNALTRATRKGMRPERLQSFFILLPSLIALFIFVYVFIGTTVYISLSSWRTLKMDLSVRQPLFQTYLDMFSMPRFHADIRNTIVFTIIFVIAGTFVGLLLAILLDHKVLGKFVFRNIFLFPYALSFVVTGVAWRWIFNPETGINLFFDISGINTLLVNLGQAPLKPGWITDPTVLFPINTLLATIIPGAATLQTKFGIPAALIPVAIAAAFGFRDGHVSGWHGDNTPRGQRVCPDGRRDRLSNLPQNYYPDARPCDGECHCHSLARLAQDIRPRVYNVWCGARFCNRRACYFRI
jgi:hypothetical protein